MPISKYDRHFGGNANKAYQSMIRRYGRTEGERIFYATKNKRAGKKKKRKKRGGHLASQVTGRPNQS